MKLLPGCRLVVAPHFQTGEGWSQRLSLGAGIARTAEGLCPLPPWRPAGADELALLLPEPARPLLREDLADCLCLFAAPAHLRSAFWDLLACAEEKGAVSGEGFDALVGQLARFLTFKELPAPPGAVFDLVLSRPGQTSVLDPGPLWGLINLGDDPASVVFVNVPGRDLPAEDYPPVRLRLEAGEGVRLPRGGLLSGSAGSAGDQSDVLLLVRLPVCGSEPVCPDSLDSSP
jgi:hypothetical protein